MKRWSIWEVLAAAGAPLHSLPKKYRKPQKKPVSRGEKQQ